MKHTIKKIITGLQMKIAGLILESGYYNELDFFNSLRNTRFNDKAFKESTLRSIFHQLDKRLLSPDISPVLIKNYEEKLAEYLNDKDIDPDFIKWSKDLLQYAKDKTGDSFSGSVSKEKLSIRPEDLAALIEERRSIRSFLDKPIPADILEEIIRTAIYAPTGCNRQNLNFLILDKKEDKVFCRKLAGEPGDFVAKAPIAIVVLTDCRTYANPNHRHQAYLESGAAVQNMLLYALSNDIGSIWLNWATNSSKKLSGFYSRFNLPSYLLPTAMVSFGYIDKWPPFLPVRKKFDSCVFK